MSSLAIQSSSSLLPLPSLSINVRPATAADLPFMDALQKMHTKNVGWMPTATLEGKIKAGHVLIAEELTADNTDSTDKTMHLSASSALSAVKSLGYCIGTDQYFKHDDVGIIYQLNVLPGRQRGLIGASLLKAQFERSAYGCKLYCCWCAQDIAANYFWEAMGFVPLAFRTGGTKGRAARGKGRAASPERSRSADGIPLLAPGPSPHAPTSRVHIFWQKRIRQGDTTTPWWFPSKTAGGSIREDRIVLPIPPGVRWSDEMPRVLPEERHEGTACPEQCRREARRHAGEELRSLPAPRKSRKAEAAPVRPAISLIASGGLRMGNAGQTALTQQSAHSSKPKREKAPRIAAKHDPRMVAAARELRDRWLEKVNRGEYQPQIAGKYEVCRFFPADKTDGEIAPQRFLAA